MFSRRIDRLTGSLIREILQLTQRPEVISFAAGLPAPDVMPHTDLSLRTQLATENTESTEKKQWVAATVGFTHRVSWKNIAKPASSLCPL